MIERLIINKILHSRDISIIRDNNLSVDDFLTDSDKVLFILNHYRDYGVVPDTITFLDAFRDFELVDVTESDKYLVYKLKEATLYKDIVPVLQECSNLVREDSIKAIEFLKDKVDSLQKSYNTSSVSGDDIVSNSMQRLEEYNRRKDVNGLLGISTGISMLDELTHGWMGEDLITIFARTNMGKSWILLYFLVSAWQQGKKVLLYSGEMSPNIVGFRFDTFNKHFSNMGLMNGSNDVDGSEYGDYINDLKRKDGFIVVTPKDFGGRKPNTDDLRALMIKYNADILGVDQITLMTDKRRGENKRIQYTNISEDLFLISEELQKPVLAVTQANRDSVKNKKEKDVAPELHEIGESDGIAQNSTRVISLNVHQGVAKLVLKKNRYGLNNKEVLMTWDIDKGILKPMLDGGQDEMDSFGF